MESEGIFRDGEIYSTRTAALRIGYNDPRMFERHVEEAGCPILRIGSKKLVSGRQLISCLERAGESFVSN